MNEAFDVYRDLYAPFSSLTTFCGRETVGDSVETYRYYEGGVSSVYLWDTEEGGFAGVVLIKKSAYTAVFES